MIKNGNKFIFDLYSHNKFNALRGEVYESLLNAVRTGRISEDRLENAVKHVLSAKERCGLLDGSGGIVTRETTLEIIGSYRRSIQYY